MAGEYNKSHDYETKPEEVGTTETQDRGLFDFMGKKKEEEKHEEAIATEFEKVKVSESEPAYYDSKPEHEEKKHETLSEKLHEFTHEEPKVEEEKKHESLAEKLHRSGSSSSSSSSDEEGDDEEKKKKRKEKKGLKEKLKEKIAGGEKEEEKKHDTEIPVEKYDHHDEAKVEPAYGEEKKGFLEKIKEKLPGSKKTEDVPVVVTPPPAPEHVEASYGEGEAKEKKGLLEKIKEKMPGYHSKTEEEKEKEKPAGSY